MKRPHHNNTHMHKPAKGNLMALERNLSTLLMNICWRFTPVEMASLVLTSLIEIWFDLSWLTHLRWVHKWQENKAEMRKCAQRSRLMRVGLRGVWSWSVKQGSVRGLWLQDPYWSQAWKTIITFSFDSPSHPLPPDLWRVTALSPLAPAALNVGVKIFSKSRFSR